MRKTFYLDESSIRVIDDYRYEHHLSSQSKAVDAILADYEVLREKELQRLADPAAQPMADDRALAQAIVDELSERFSGQLTRIENHGKFTDRNVQVMIEIFNSILTAGDYPTAVGTSYSKHPVVQEAEREVKRQLSTRKQKVDNAK